MFFRKYCLQILDTLIGVWGDKNIIVEGHGRLAACKTLGMDVVPVVRLDHLSDVQRLEYAIAHNATAKLSRWDADILSIELHRNVILSELCSFILIYKKSKSCDLLFLYAYSCFYVKRSELFYI